VDKQDQQAANIWDHLTILLKWRKLVFVYMFIMAISSVTYSLLARQWFASEASVLPPPNTSMGLDSFLPGLNLGALGFGADMSDDALLVTSILESRRLRDEVIDKYNWMERRNFKHRIKAYKLFNKHFKWEVVEDGSIHLKLIEDSKELSKETLEFILAVVEREYIEISKAQARNHSNFINNRLEQNKRELKEAEEALQSFQERTGVILLEEQFAASIDNLSELHKQLIASEIQLNVMSNVLPSTSSEVKLLRNQVTETQEMINSINSSGNDSFDDILISLESAPDLGVQYIRLQREVEIQTSILQFLIPQYEQAHIQELKDSSGLYLMDPASYPDKKLKPRRAFVVVAWMFISFALLYMYIAFIEWLIAVKSEDPDHYETVSNVLNGLKLGSLFRLKNKSSVDIS
jgi:uncharacterized protein involved in exopolysaccharide biosynthesis